MTFDYAARLRPAPARIRFGLPRRRQLKGLRRSAGVFDLGARVSCRLSVDPDTYRAAALPRLMRLVCVY